MEIYDLFIVMNGLENVIIYDGMNGGMIIKKMVTNKIYIAY